MFGKKKNTIEYDTASEYEGKLIECNEGDLAWIRKSEILDLNLWEGDRVS